MKEVVHASCIGFKESVEPFKMGSPYFGTLCKQSEKTSPKTFEYTEVTCEKCLEEMEKK